MRSHGIFLIFPVFERRGGGTLGSSKNQIGQNSPSCPICEGPGRNSRQSDSADHVQAGVEMKALLCLLAKEVADSGLETVLAQ